MRKADQRFLSIPLMLLALWLWNGIPAFAAGNLVANGDFEQTENGMPVGWTTEAWIKDDAATVYAAEQGAAQSGQWAAAVRNNGDNHARFIQNVKVDGDKLYRISGYVKAEGLRSEAYGAYLSVEGVAVNYPQVHDTGGQWSFLEFYGKTEKDQKEIAIGVSVGGYGSINAGTGWFDGITVEEVSEAPEGTAVFSLASTPVSGGEEEKAPLKVSILSTLVYAALFTAGFAVAMNALIRRKDRFAPGQNMGALLLFGGFAVALALRIAIGLTHDGYVNDIALFTFWSDQVVKDGIAGFYHSDIFVDYPPGYIYVLYGLGLLKEWFGLTAGSAGTLLLYKLPAIAADLAAAAVVYRAAKGKLGEAPAIGLALLYAFNPAAILDSAAWGQVDAVFALVLTLAIAGMADRKFGRASVWYAIAALIKPQTFIFMPVLLLALFLNKKWKDVAISAYYGFGTFIVLALPFYWGNGGLKGVYELYKGTLSSYPYATLNAFNLYALNGANWKPITESWLFLTYQQWGTAFILLAVAAAVCFSLIRSKRGGEDRSFYVAAMLIAIVFIGVTKMHERYMFPVMLLSLFAYIQSMDRRMLRVFFGFTITNFINISYVLKFSVQTSNVPTDGVVILCAIANIGLLLYAMYVGHDLYRNRNRQEVRQLLPEDGRLADAERLALYRGDRPIESKTASRRLASKDWRWMGGITAVYTIVALVNLGSLKDPETVWHPASAGEGFYVDLGETKQLERLTSFGGVGTGTYTYEFGLTPDAWGNKIEIDNNHVYVFAWKSQQLNVEARYVKLTVTGAGFSMNELGFYEAGSKEPLPISSIVALSDKEPKRGSLHHLFDEQGLMVYNHNFMKGSYFDEIYHARTAYENLEGLVAYENTHPPLGKLFIALGIKLFGLNPFGWRIAGTLFGAAMIPLIYLMARRLFGGTTFAVVAAMLLAADFMHFAQTRIATIDVYGVFFIMLMFYFMHRYVTMSFYRSSLAATFVPLGLAGFVFGLGVASKWIVLYGGAGLAVMLALSLIDRYKEHAAARRLLKRGEGTEAYNRTELERAARLFPRNALLTLAACLLFYVAIPLGIYALSYIPILNVMQGGYTLKALVDYQTHMYSYHSNLVSSHPFSSSWWEWPFMKRPVWYYSGSELPEGMKSTIMAMGNPLIWWTGLFTMLAAMVMSVKRRDKSAYMIWIAFLAQYVPWMLVPRETFLYHYFAMVPFIILGVVYCLKAMEEKYPAFAKARNLYVAAAVALFILFYPALSGMLVPKWYVDVLLRWFPSWLF
ncbi:glycosyltransferase family 39 protein [Paenibacillus sp. LHD-117]|uniref:glycosyltransferase family 39 protein n=1 Tax=Paenibacillus sp. LHD-117 TaxID=3071412 RepID=UPI0027DEFA94|nr:glycosyltransferase family 39 protein [Paenibacillus sp. LHD-117]MDQ6418344.1 glycosyltransferase family 39 protein [Paenibacillus sp. LHD-117]